MVIPAALVMICVGCNGPEEINDNGVGCAIMHLVPFPAVITRDA